MQELQDETQVAPRYTRYCEDWCYPGKGKFETLFIQMQHNASCNQNFYTRQKYCNTALQQFTTVSVTSLKICISAFQSNTHNKIPQLPRNYMEFFCLSLLSMGTEKLKEKKLSGKQFFQMYIDLLISSTHTDPQMHAHTQTHMHAHTSTHTHIYACIYTHACTCMRKTLHVVPKLQPHTCTNTSFSLFAHK